MCSLAERLRARESGLCFYGLSPPKQATPEAQLKLIARQQVERLQAMAPDGVIIYDIQDERDRISEPRPFPFLPTLDPSAYAQEYLSHLTAEKIIYRCVNRDTPATFIRWLELQHASMRNISVLVGAPSQSTAIRLPLAEAYRLAHHYAADLLLGGVAIAERHASSGTEQMRMLSKADRGCRFFVTQAVYDVSSTKSLISDYVLAVHERGALPMPVIITLSPCGAPTTLEFMKWLGITFPRWLENELRLARDPLATSLALCERIFDEVWDYAREKQTPVGVNVESVSIRRAEIEASGELFRRLKQRLRTACTE